MKPPAFIKFFPYILFVYHLCFAYLGWDYVTQNQGDALRYWLVGQDLSHISWLDYFQPGTDIIKIITFPLVKYLHLPFWSGFLLFSGLSFIGFYQLWHLILSLTQNNKGAFWVGILLLLLPNLHLWTSFIGKESILFVALVLMVDQILKKQILSKTFIASFLLVALIRPHVAVILLISVLIAYFWKGGLSTKAQFYLGGISALSFLGLYFIVKKIAFIRNNPWDRIIHIYSYHIKGLQKTDAYVPLDQYSLPYKLFTFYYRPLPFEKAGLFYQIWSFENLLFLVLSLAVLFVIVRQFQSIEFNLYEIFTIAVILLMATMYVYAYANYGLTARTKIMVMPFVYVLMVKVFAQWGRD